MSLWESLGVYKGIDYTGKYEAHPDGLIRSSKSGYIREGIINSIGYRRVALSKNGKKKHTSVHRIIASVFLPMIPDKTYINHKNQVRDDNTLENLEWCTQSENVLHSISINGTRQYRSGRVYKYKDGQLFHTYDNTKDAAKDFECSATTIRNYYRSGKEYKGFTLGLETFEDPKPENGIPIEGYPNYLVTPEGHVYSLYSNSYLALVKTDCGHLSVLLDHDRRRVSHLVATAFIGNPKEDELYVVHKNGDKTMCDISNLKWSTRSQAMISYYESQSIDNGKPVYMYGVDGVIIKSFPSTIDASNKLKISQQRVSKLCLSNRAPDYKKSGIKYILRYELL